MAWQENIGQKRLMLAALVPIVLFGWVVSAQSPPSQEAPPGKPEELTPAIRAMLDVLLDEKTPIRLRQGNAEALLLNSEAHSELIKILNMPNNITAKQVICQAIATHNAELLSTAKSGAVPVAFVEPLLEILKSDDSELSSWAAQALSKCRNGVVDKLAELIKDESQSQEHRLAGVTGLSLMPGRKPILALSLILDDKDAVLRQRASAALANMLDLKDPVIAEEFRMNYLDTLANMSEADYLSWQLARQQKRFRQVKAQITQAQEDSNKWRDRCLTAWSRELGQLALEKRLEMLEKFMAQSDRALVRIWALGQVEQWCRDTPGQNTGALSGFLKGFVGDDNPRVRLLAARSLGQLGDKAKSTAIDILKQLQQEHDGAAQGAQLHALGVFEYTQAADTAISLLGSSDSSVVAEAAWLLGGVGSKQGDNTLTSQQIQLVAEKLSQSYHDHKAKGHGISALREIIRAMSKITDQEAHQKLAAKYFDKIFEETLDDNDGTLRQLAVVALCKLHNENVLKLLVEDRSLLDDSETRVRYAVIDAIQKKGGKGHLDILHQQLLKESKGDVSNIIVSAFCKILNSLSTKDAYEWSIKLENASEKEQSLKQNVLNILSQKIAHDKEAKRPVPTEYEALLYIQQARQAEADKQLPQAVSFYAKLYRLELPPEQKSQFADKVLDLALSNHSNPGLLDQAKGVVAELLADQASCQATLDKIAKACDQLVKDDNDLTQAGRIVTTFVVGIKKYPSEQVANTWAKRQKQIALKLIGQQEKLLDVKDGKEIPEVIALLEKLDGRLKGYPSFDTPIAKRRAVLAKFRTTLVPPAPSAPPPPAPSTPPPPPSPPPSTPESTPQSESPSTPTEQKGKQPEQKASSETSASTQPDSSQSPQVTTKQPN